MRRRSTVSFFLRLASGFQAYRFWCFGGPCRFDIAAVDEERPEKKTTGEVLKGFVAEAERKSLILCLSLFLRHSCGISQSLILINLPLLTVLIRVFL